MDDRRLARYGIDLHEVNNLMGSAMSGREVGSFYEHQWRFPVIVRLAEKYRENCEKIHAYLRMQTGAKLVPILRSNNRRLALRAQNQSGL